MKLLPKGCCGHGRFTPCEKRTPPLSYGAYLAFQRHFDIGSGMLWQSFIGSPSTF
ncbi:MAG: hypothetical protein RR198_02625 [Oscillospiraceae bacterium]